MTDQYKPKLLLKNGHLNTVYPTLLRKQKKIPFVRERIQTGDDDFLDIDILKNGSKRAVFLFHGLEGSSESKYIQGTAGIMNEHGWDVIAANYRGCSGVMNKQLRMYHSGATDDVHTIITNQAEQYDEIALVGFSLGGNLVLKYLGEQLFELYSHIIGAVAISVPLDLKAGSVQIGSPTNLIYTKKFLGSLIPKIKAKYEQFPNAISLAPLKHIKTLYDFDNLYTAPIHGFANADDYYSKCSSKQFLHNVVHDTLIINALDDPFLPQSCYPTDLSAKSNFELMTPKYGGHVGFVQPFKKYYWEEEMIAQYLNKKSSLDN